MRFFIIIGTNMIVAKNSANLFAQGNPRVAWKCKKSVLQNDVQVLPFVKTIPLSRVSVRNVIHFARLKHVNVKNAMFVPLRNQVNVRNIVFDPFLPNVVAILRSQKHIVIVVVVLNCKSVTHRNKKNVAAQPWINKQKESFVQQLQNKNSVVRISRINANSMNIVVAGHLQSQSWKLSSVRKSAAMHMSGILLFILWINIFLGNNR